MWTSALYISSMTFILVPFFFCLLLSFQCLLVYVSAISIRRPTYPVGFIGWSQCTDDGMHYRLLFPALPMLLCALPFFLSEYAFQNVKLHLGIHFLFGLWNNRSRRLKIIPERVPEAIDCIIMELFMKLRSIFC